MSRGKTYNLIVTDELWEQVEQENKDLLNEFIEYKTSTDKSLNTIYQYTSVIKLFFCWNVEHNNNKVFVDIKKREFVKFFSYMTNQLNASPNRLRTVRAILSSFSNFIENILDEDYEGYRNNIKKIETVAIEPVREKTILTQEQVDECLEKLVELGKYQIACFMALACASGARKAELLRFKANYFTKENIVFGCLYKTPEKIATKGRGSRGKMLYKYVFVQQFQRYYDLWMEERKRLGIESEWLFVTRDRENGGYKQAEVSTVGVWAKVISGILGCDFYFHSLRHFLISYLRAKKLPDPVIIELIGWNKESGGAMISIYDDNEIIDSFADYFDENGIKDVQTTKLSDM